MPTVSILPAAGRPQLPKAEFEALIAPYGIDLAEYPLVVAGIRGFFAAAGATPGNERNIYDDALFLYAPAHDLYAGFNGNTDPSKFRPGAGRQEGSRGIASLNPGAWFSYHFDMHRGKAAAYEAICQRAAPVTVTRDGTPPYPDSGWFGINIHRGGNYSTSSEGCQTIPPQQWGDFITAAQDAGRALFKSELRKRVIPYVLIDAAAIAAEASAPLAGAAPPKRNPTRRELADAFLRGTIRPTLQQLGLWSTAAEQLLLGTALAESGLTERVQWGGGPARGLFQMEPATHDDIWANFLRYRSPLATAIRALAGPAATPSAALMEQNDAYACAMARAHYLRVRAALPPAGDQAGMAAYWKAHYNTPGGKGTVAHYDAAWQSAYA